MKHRSQLGRPLLLVLLSGALAVAGCEGPAGKDGANGANGTNGAPGATGATGAKGADGTDAYRVSNVPDDNAFLSTTTFDNSSITSVSINSNNKPVVEFRIVDGNGNGVDGLGTVRSGTGGANLDLLRFTIAKLVPGTDGSVDKWVSYEIGTNFANRNHEKVSANLEALGDGNYRYTFERDLTAVTDVSYEPDLTHRVGIRLSGFMLRPVYELHNPRVLIKDFAPSGGALRSHEVTTKAACMECHIKFQGGHVDGYNEPRMCVLCHTDQWRKGETESAIEGTTIKPEADKETNVVRGEAILNMTQLIHKAHMGNRLTLTGYSHNRGNFLFNEMVYPQDAKNCLKCHGASAEAPEGDNWKNMPNRMACGACHDGVDFANDPRNHPSVQDDSMCAICHTAANIELVHRTAMSTPHNPNAQTALVNYSYEIKSLTANESRQPVVVFRILADGTAVRLNTYAANGPPILLDGFTGGPSFLVAYGLTQDDVPSPDDFTNYGNASGLPTQIELLDVWNGGKGTLSGPDGSGYYTAVLSGATFPTDAKLRTVALSGYFTQKVAGKLVDQARPAKAAVAALQYTVGDATKNEARRQIVDDAKCANCHEWLTSHDGQTVYSTGACVLCHNPNLSSSGRTMGPAGNAEATLNFKDMIHSLHAAAQRANPYVFTTVENSVPVNHDWSDVAYPTANRIRVCEGCHKPGTYGAVPSAALMSTSVTTQDATAALDPATGLVASHESPDDVKAARSATINPEDIVTTPFTAACLGCHDTDPAKAHMRLQGGSINEKRANASPQTEACAVCHGSGRSEDATVVHATPEI